MTLIDQHKQEMDAYDGNILESLQVNDALIVVAVCASKERRHPVETADANAERITDLARQHPLFAGARDSIAPRVHKFMNSIGRTTDLVEPVAAAVKVLDPDGRRTAFRWAADIIMPDGVLTEDRRETLDRYAARLQIDPAVARKIPVDISKRK